MWRIKCAKSFGKNRYLLSLFKGFFVLFGGLILYRLPHKVVKVLLFRLFSRLMWWAKSTDDKFLRFRPCVI
jgi:hypothetical protein